MKPNNAEFFSKVNEQLGIKTLFAADTGPFAYGSFGSAEEHKPSYTIVGYDQKPDVYKFPRSSFIDTVLTDAFPTHIHTRVYAPEKFLRMAMNSTVGALEIVLSPMQESVNNLGADLRAAVDHYFNPSLMWDSVTGTLIGMTNFKGEEADVTGRRAMHLNRLFTIRCMLEDGVNPLQVSIGEYWANGADTPSRELARHVYEWCVIDQAFNHGLPEQMRFSNLRVENPVANTNELQKNRPGFSAFANAKLAKFMEYM